LNSGIEYEEGLPGHWYDYLKFWRVFSAPAKVHEELLKFLKTQKPDILALIEADRGSLRSHFRDNLLDFEEKLKFSGLVEALKYPLKGIGRAFHFIPILREQSNALLSRYKLTDIKHHYLREGSKRVIIEASVHCPHRTTLLVAHLALGARSRKIQFHDLTHIVNGISNPVILMGDFNTFHGVHEIDYLRNHTSLKDAYKLHPSCLPYIHPAWHPSRRLDYVLVSPQIKVRDYCVLKCELSDHLPLQVDFELRS
jgi:endonuclease/exonuclease/phosphatase family metal-dependent hydrolase